MLLVKGFYERLFDRGDGAATADGGRVTELVARPLVKLRQFVRADGKMSQRARPVPTHERPPVRSLPPGEAQPHRTPGALASPCPVTER